MPAPVPTLGYPTRTAAVQALAANGLHTSEIARRIGIEEKSVSALLCSARRSKRPAEKNGRTVLFPIDILNALRIAAAKRNISVNELARRIVEAVADDGLIDAVLDDGGTE